MTGAPSRDEDKGGSYLSTQNPCASTPRGTLNLLRLSEAREEPNSQASWSRRSRQNVARGATQAQPTPGLRSVLFCRRGRGSAARAAVHRPALIFFDANLSSDFSCCEKRRVNIRIP